MLKDNNDGTFSIVAPYSFEKPKRLSDEEIDYYTKAYFNIHPDAHLSEQFKIKLYELQEFARAIEERHGIK
jgi:hypothetical protein